MAGLIGAAIAIAIAALVASPPKRATASSARCWPGGSPARPAIPCPCGRNPLALAYGFPLGKLVRSLAPTPEARDGELPVDFRYCQSSQLRAPGLRCRV